MWESSAESGRQVGQLRGSLAAIGKIVMPKAPTGVNQTFREATACLAHPVFTLLHQLLDKQHLHS